MELKPKGRMVAPCHFVAEEKARAPLGRRVGRVLWTIFLAALVVAIVVALLAATGEGIVPVSR